LLDLPPRGDQDILVVEAGRVLWAAGGCGGRGSGGFAGRLQPNPSTVDEKKRKFFAGACKLREGLMVLLDPALLDPIRLAKAG
jgi:hypothetical protein